MCRRGCRDVSAAQRLARARAGAPRCRMALWPREHGKLRSVAKRDEAAMTQPWPWQPSRPAIGSMLPQTLVIHSQGSPLFSMAGSSAAQLRSRMPARARFLAASAPAKDWPRAPGRVPRRASCWPRSSIDGRRAISPPTWLVRLVWPANCSRCLGELNFMCRRNDVGAPNLRRASRACLPVPWRLCHGNARVRPRNQIKTLYLLLPPCCSQTHSPYPLQTSILFHCFMIPQKRRLSIGPTRSRIPKHSHILNTNCYHRTTHSPS